MPVLRGSNVIRSRSLRILLLQPCGRRSRFGFRDKVGRTGLSEANEKSSFCQ